MGLLREFLTVLLLTISLFFGLNLVLLGLVAFTGLGQTIDGSHATNYIIVLFLISLRLASISENKISGKKLLGLSSLFWLVGLVFLIFGSITVVRMIHEPQGKESPINHKH